MTSTAEIALPTMHVAPSAPRYPTARLLGTLGMVGAPLLLIETILFALLGRSLERPDRLMGATSLLYMGAWISSAAGMRRLRAAGDGARGRIVLGVQWIGQMLALVWAVVMVVTPDGAQGTTIMTVADAAWPLSHVYMLVVGVATLHAGVWRGWRRWAPLACGMILPIAALANVLLPHAAVAWVFSGYAAIAWTVLGYAVRTGGGTSRR